MDGLELPMPATSHQIRKLVIESKEPLVFRKFLSHWDILSWSLEKWAEILGDKPLPFRSNNREFDQQPQWESRCHTVHLTMNEFLENCKLETSKWFYFDYKHLEEWFSENSKILESVTWDTFGFPERKGKDSTLWIGSRGAHTPCHLDSYGYNLVAQVHGRKQWILFPPDATASMLPTRVPYEESSIYSSRNFNYPDPHMANDLQGAQPRVLTLNPGDVLLVPHHWWHYVENIDTAISINTWIPMQAEDNDERVNEALVRLFISQTCKDLSNSSSFLNPNEVDLIDYPLSVLMSQIHSSVESSMKSLEEVQHPEPAEKKSRLSCEHQDSHSEGQIVSQTLGINSITIVPKCSHTEFQDLLANKRKALKEVAQKYPIESSKSVEQSSNDVLIQKVINSFCHPDVISLVKAKLISEKIHPGVPNI